MLNQRRIPQFEVQTIRFGDPSLLFSFGPIPVYIVIRTCGEIIIN